MKIKTSELTDAALDWAVAKCENLNVRVKECDDLVKRIIIMTPIPCPDNKPGCCVAHFRASYYSLTTNWAQGGPILEAHWKDISAVALRWMLVNDVEPDKPSLLDFWMRCYVASVLGDEVDVPEVLA